MKMLYLQASPRTARSHAIKTADIFMDAWRKRNTGAEVVTRNVFTQNLPEFGGEAVNARYLVPRGLDATDAERDAWASVLQVVEEFKSFNRYLFAVPMWNYSVPYKFKQYIDLFFQPSHTFMFKDEAYKAAVAEKKICLVLSRGGQYPEGSPMDFQTPYLEHIFKLMGFSAGNIHKIILDGTNMDKDFVARMHEEKTTQAVRLAESF